MSKQDLADYVFASRYARWNPEKNRRMTFQEAGQTMFDMHRRRYGELGQNVLDYIDSAQKAFEDKKILGSQRALQFGGQPIEDKNARIYNCCSSYCDRPRFFAESFWLLLCGCGVGFSVQKHHVAQLPSLEAPLGQAQLFKIPDSIEGWACALDELVNSYVNGHIPIVFDYSLIRPEGSPLSSGAGVAPGPEPLRNALEKIRTKLTECAFQKGRLDPIDAYDVVMFAADAVLAGGVRRSACIAIFSPDDEDMINAKTGDWLTTNPQRARSNNSALLLRDKTSFERFMAIMEKGKEYGEPGFFWSDSTEHVPNPCVEIGLLPKNANGVSGWQFCNLSVINAAACETEEDFYAACENAAALGTLQAGYTNFDFLGLVSEQITEREALIGVSITGIQEAPHGLLTAPVLQRGARRVNAVNAEVATLIGINPAARTTCIKPEGTSSCILGTTSGIHPAHGKKYIRRVIANRNDVLAALFKEENPLAVEGSAWSNNDMCLAFPIRSEGVTRSNMSAFDLLEDVLFYKRNWVDVGKTRSRCTDPTLSHNVSNTLTIDPDQWAKVAEEIFEYQADLAGVSFVPNSSDLDWEQPVFCEVLDPAELLYRYGQHGVMQAAALVDEAQSVFGSVYAACKAIDDQSRQGRVDTREQAVYVIQARQKLVPFFTTLKKATEVMLHVYNTNTFALLEATSVPVDYSQALDKKENVKLSQTVACAGGACEVM